MKIYIPSKKETENIKQGIEDVTIENNNNKVNEKININTANKEELKKITGIGDTLAQKIIEYRIKNSKF